MIPDPTAELDPLEKELILRVVYNLMPGHIYRQLYLGVRFIDNYQLIQVYTHMTQTRRNLTPHRDTLSDAAALRYMYDPIGGRRH